MDATVSYMKKLTREAPPGQRWHYSTGETNLIGVLVAQATKKNLASYASEKIWARYGMESDASWMLDRTGHEHGGCCIQATTRDFARLGQFILDGARIKGQSIVAGGWLEAATHKQVDIGQPGFGYGYQWWTRDNGTFNAYRHSRSANPRRPGAASSSQSTAPAGGKLHEGVDRLAHRAVRCHSRSD